MTASATGTATNLEDLVTKIINFLTTDTNLIAANQEWVVNRQHRDGIVSVLTNMTESSSVQARRILHSCRYEPRSLNIDNTSNNESFTQCSNFIAGTSYVRFQLRTAKEIRNVRLRAPNSGSETTNMIRNFRLQYSDNDSTWSTALTVTGAGAWGTHETRNFAVSSFGSHVYWRIIIDSISSGTVVYWKNLLLQELDGTIANHFGSEVYFQAPGNSGTDEIYTGLRSEYDSSNGWYNLFLNGYTGFDPSVNEFFDQPGSLPGYNSTTKMEVAMIPCWNQSMNYWFAASGRAFKFGVKVSTSFEGGYMGFILPYATPNQYPYPLAIGGSLIPSETARGPEWRYSYNNYKHSVFTTPASITISTTPNGSTLYLRTPDGEWRSFGSRGTSSDPNRITTMDVPSAFPYIPTGAAAIVWPTGILDFSAPNGALPERDCLGGGYILQPCILLTRTPSPQVFGELEGVFIISGFNNAAENTTVFNSTNYIIFQNVARTEVHEFWALALP
jgi:hypothetical protein